MLQISSEAARGPKSTQSADDRLLVSKDFRFADNLLGSIAPFSRLSRRELRDLLRCVSPIHNFVVSTVPHDNLSRRRVLLQRLIPKQNSQAVLKSFPLLPGSAPVEDLILQTDRGLSMHTKILRNKSRVRFLVKAFTP